MGFLMSDWVNPVLIEKTVAHQLRTPTCPRSRFYVHLPKTQNDLKSSMSALACGRKRLLFTTTITIWV
jgi:hypothetical protein